ncbi:hypothetical protein PZA11_003325 [Diplocarpon coronariae]
MGIFVVATDILQEDLSALENPSPDIPSTLQDIVRYSQESHTRVGSLVTPTEAYK